MLGQGVPPTITGGLIKDKKAPGLVEKLSVWIRGNLFIPDARKVWIKPSVGFLYKYLSEHQIDALVSTGPPHSMHLIALKLKQRLNIPWLADFRDPWTDIDYYKEMKISVLADKKHKQLELETILNCSAMVVVSREMKENYEKMGSRNVQLITNGFDPDDMGFQEVIPDTKFSVSHIGTLPPAFNLTGLWQILGELSEADPQFRDNLEIKLVGKVDASVIGDLSKYKLEKNLSLPGYVPHDKAAQLMKQSAVLLLVINQNSPNAKGILTGKIFEYIAARRPILAIGPTDGDLSRILKESEAGTITAFNDLDLIRKTILDLYDKYLHNGLINREKRIEKFTRKNLTAQLADVLNDITS